MSSNFRAKIKKILNLNSMWVSILTDNVADYILKIQYLTRNVALPFISVEESES